MWLGEVAASSDRQMAASTLYCSLPPSACHPATVHCCHSDQGSSRPPTSVPLLPPLALLPFRWGWERRWGHFDPSCHCLPGRRVMGTGSRQCPSNLCFPLQTPPHVTSQAGKTWEQKAFSSTLRLVPCSLFCSSGRCRRMLTMVMAGETVGSGGC